MNWCCNKYREIPFYRRMPYSNPGLDSTVGVPNPSLAATNLNGTNLHLPNVHTHPPRIHHKSFPHTLSTDACDEYHHHISSCPCEELLKWKPQSLPYWMGKGRQHKITLFASALECWWSCFFGPTHVTPTHTQHKFSNQIAKPPRFSGTIRIN